MEQTPQAPMFRTLDQMSGPHPNAVSRPWVRKLALFSWAGFGVASLIGLFSSDMNSPHHHHWYDWLQLAFSVLMVVSGVAILIDRRRREDRPETN